MNTYITEKLKYYKKKKFVILILVVLFTSLLMVNFSGKNQNLTSIKDEINDESFVDSLKPNDISIDNSFTGVGLPWNVTHFANYTKSNLQVSFNNNSFDDTHAQVELHGWNGYQLNSTITNLYDTRNWINGTFHAGSFGGSPSGSDDSEYIDDWTFKTQDIQGYTNPMSGNYYDSSASTSDYEDCLELRIQDDTGGGGHYDIGDKCWWESTFELDRGDVDEALLSFAIRPKYGDGYNNHMVMQVLANGKLIWGNGLQSLLDASGSPTSGQWYNPYPIYLNGNDAQIFPEGVKDINITIEFKRVSGTAPSAYASSYSVLFDNVSLIVKSQAKPTQIGLQLNGENVLDNTNYGEGSLGINGNWNGSLQTSVIANFSSNQNWDYTYKDDGNWQSYKIDFSTNLNIYTYKSTPETYYIADSSLEFQGSSFITSNSSNTNWSTYAHMEVPAGYEETNMTIEYTNDYNLTGIFFSLNPDSLSQASIKEIGNIKIVNIPVSSITSNTNGFWKLTAESPNYCEYMEMYSNATGSWELTNKYLSGQYINITAKVDNSGLISSYIQQTKAYLQLRFPNGTIWAVQNQIKTVDNTGMVYFDPILIPDDIPNYKAGEYEAIITWNNSYSSFGTNESGIVHKKFTVIHDSVLYPDQGIYFIEEVFDDRIINIKVSFRDIKDGTAINNAYIYTDYSGEEEELFQTSPGFFLYEFNASKANAGNNTITIYANSSYYVNKIINITVEVIKNTILTVETDFFTTPWNQNFTVRFNYTEEINPVNKINTSDITLNGWFGDYHLTQLYVGEYILECNNSVYSALTLQSFIISVNAYKYESQTVLIRVQITELASSINNVTLNGESTNSIQIDWNELVDINICYNESATGNFIQGATVEIIGTDFSDLLSQSGNQYSITINTSLFNIGNNFLTILAQKENYNIASKLITISVEERPTNIVTILNHTISNSITFPHGELLNFTVIYTDASGPFIEGASVELREGGIVKYVLDPSPTYNQYFKEINTNKFNLGVNLLTLYAKKDNYSAAFASITLTINKRDTSLEVLLDENATTTIEKAYNENVNITVIYKDFSDSFIEFANVELRMGGITIGTFDEQQILNLYNLTINTKNLNLGTNLLAIHANIDNYSEALASITITVRERDTLLEIYLESVEQTSIEIQWGESLNISAIYRDGLGPKITGATVQLRTGGEIVDTFVPNNNQYTLMINTDNLNLGSNIFSIYAKQDNYSVAIESISIVVTERGTTLSIFLDDVERTNVEVTYGEMVNLTAIYKDYTENLITFANVELRKGGTKLDDLAPNANQYVLLKNSNEFDLGSNVLSIYAHKDNYSVALVSILIIVKERDTSIKVILNGLDTDNFDIYNISVNENLNFTAIYKDFTDLFITSATVELKGTSISEMLVQHPSFNQYNYTLNPEVLGVGVHFLVISANRENYSSIVKNIKINVIEKGSDLHLLINGDDLTLERYIEVEIDQILNVTVYFTDSFDDNFISGAYIRLTGALNDNFTENAYFEYYNVTIQTNDLDQGINFLTVFAQKQDYEYQSIIFTVEVKEKETNLQLFLNEDDQTLGKSIEVVVGDLVNITIIYEDTLKNFIDGAEVIILGEGINFNLTKHPFYNQYNISINSELLNFGINFLTLYAKKANYQPQTLTLKIEINDKETNMHIFLNGLNKTIDKTLTLPIQSELNVTIKYTVFDTDSIISGATIQLVGESLNKFLDYDPIYQQYYTTIDTSILDIGVRFLTIYAQKANYQSYSALLRIQVERIRTNITTVSGETVVNRKPGESYHLKINLHNLDFNTEILNATVTYTWTYGQGALTDPDNDGIYEGDISDLREGTFIVTISVYAGDDYEFERFTITLNVIRPTEDVLLFQILTIIGVSAAVGLGGYLYMYQKILKYPQKVRKIHKYKSHLKSSKPLGLETPSRDQLVEEAYLNKLRPLEKQLKGNKFKN